MTTLVIPESPAELEEMVSDGPRMQAVIADGKFGEFINAYQARVATKAPELTAEIKEQIQLGFAEWMKDLGAKDAPPVDMTPGPQARPRIEGIQSLSLIHI